MFVYSIDPGSMAPVDEGREPPCQDSQPTRGRRPWSWATYRNSASVQKLQKALPDQRKSKGREVL